MNDKLDSKKEINSTIETSAVVSETEADKIWKEIRNKELEMFSLSGQTVEKYYKPIQVEPSKLYGTITVQSVIPALESALSSKFDIEFGPKYIIISRKKGV